jgi:DNA-binding NtrC family response regulator
MAFEGIVGASDPMQEIFEAIAKVAPTDMSVLIEGESGTGKELVARAIHARSLRANGPLAAISCPSIPKDLIESELFGHERGAFTGAYASRPGRIEAADHGTLFLDEIGDIAEATQSKLLRFLQEREFQRVGGRTSIRVDVRLVAATSRDLRQEILAGRFREDLLYRLNVASLRLPALRDRIEDLPLLVDTFLCKLAGRRGRRVLGITDEVHRLLMDYPWPGNIRELQNVLEYLVAMSHDDRITAEHVPENVRKAAKQAAFERSQKEREKDRERELPTLRSGETLDARLLSLEGELIRGALERCGGNQSRAARMLGITVTRIRLRMRRYGLETEESRESEGLAAEGSSKPLRRRSRRKRARGPAGERNV